MNSTLRRSVLVVLTLTAVLSLAPTSSNAVRSHTRHAKLVHAAAAPSITLSSSTAIAGDLIGVSGSNFAKKVKYTVLISDRTVASGTTSRYGKFKTSFTVPVLAAGSYKVATTANTLTASAPLTIIVPDPAPTPSPDPAPAPAPDPSTTGIWKPALHTTWQYQLTGVVDQSINAQFVVIDLFDNSSSVVDGLRTLGKSTGCYFSAGSYENWRPDAGSFPAAVLGKSNGWAGERWLDIRRLDVLGPIMEARLDACKAKGFVGVDPDNVDGYENDTGFPLTATDQLRYNQFLADAAHARGMSVGLKNDLSQVPSLVGSFDWAINEQCAQYKECDLLAPFIDSGKPVFEVEYSLTKDKFCASSLAAGFMPMRKTLDLDAWWDPCWT